MTFSDHNSMTSYMRDVQSYPLVNRNQEKELANLIQKGSEKAKQKLITANLRLVVKIAHEYKGYGLPFQDIIAEGNIGLIRAVEKFDSSKGVKFSSYASWWIKQAIRRAMNEKTSTIRIPVTSARKIRKIRNVRTYLKDQLGRDPEDGEVSEASGLSIRVVTRLKYADLQTTSLHAPISSEGQLTLKDLIKDEKSRIPDSVFDRRDTIERLEVLLLNLDRRERVVLSMRYGLGSETPKTLDEVSKIIGRTRERVRQIQTTALKKLFRQFSEKFSQDSAN